MISFPNCKINLGLSVTEKRNDGFHQVETVMYPLQLADILEIIESPDREIRFELSGINLEGERKLNLVMKAYNLLKQTFNLPPVHIYLHKAIPSGAGLGGGSSDAAFTIKMLNSIFNLGLSSEEMQNQSRKLGTDCAFFIANKPVLAFNKGDEFKNVHVDLTDYRIVICKPDIHIDTTKAYSWIKPEKKHTSPGDVVSMPVSEWKGNLVNDFEEEVFIRYPEISQIRSMLYGSGALYASLTGSGAAVYGIFKPETHINPDCITGFYWQGI